MHTIGKVFLGLNLLLVIGAVLLTSRLISTRNYWMQQVSQREQQIRTNNEQIAQKEKELAGLQADLVRQRMTWDTMLLAPNCRANPDGTVIVGAGQNVGFGVVPQDAPPPVVHVFVPQGTQSVYLGPFRIAEVGPAQSQLAPMFRIQANEPQEWTAGNWRLWQMVPSDAPSRVVDLTSEIVEKLEVVASREDTLALQQKAVDQAQAHLEGRRRELLGNPQAAKIEGVPEVSDGLVVAFRDAEASRNASLAELDRLRREVNAAYDRLSRLVNENTEIVRRSGGASPGPRLSSAE